MSNQLKHGVVPAPTILTGAERRDGERSEADRSGEPAKIVADPAPGAPVRASGAAFADFNNDGWIDVAVSAIDDPPSLLINARQPGTHWALIALEGRKPNRFGIGARVTVKAGGTTQTREAKAGGSFASSNDPRQHFGLGPSARIEELTVAWPSGRKSVLRDLEADRVIQVPE